MRLFLSPAHSAESSGKQVAESSRSRTIDAMPKTAASRIDSPPDISANQGLPPVDHEAMDHSSDEEPSFASPLLRPYLPRLPDPEPTMHHDGGGSGLLEKQPAAVTRNLDDESDAARSKSKSGPQSSRNGSNLPEVGAKPVTAPPFPGSINTSSNVTMPDDVDVQMPGQTNADQVSTQTPSGNPPNGDLPEQGNSADAVNATGRTVNPHDRSIRYIVWKVILYPREGPEQWHLFIESHERRGSNGMIRDSPGSFWGRYYRQRQPGDVDWDFVPPPIFWNYCTDKEDFDWEALTMVPLGHVKREDLNTVVATVATADPHPVLYNSYRYHRVWFVNSIRELLMANTLKVDRLGARSLHVSHNIPRGGTGSVASHGST